MSAKTVLVLRTCAADMTSHNGTFTWPQRGPVEAPDWRPIAECGHGLHGLAWGEGDGTLLNWNDDAKWLVVLVAAADIVEIGRKVKYPRGTVVHCGDRLSATTYLAKHGGEGKAIVGGTAMAGYRGTAMAGDGGTVIVKRWDGKRYKFVVGYVGEDGIKPNVAYRADDAGNLVEAKS